MPVVEVDRFERAELKARPDWLFVFGDNEQRRGLGGQAKACRGEPNACGVATKRAPSLAESAFWSDADFERCVLIIDADLARAFEQVRRGGTVALPSGGLGTGLADLPARAPRVFAHLQGRLQALREAGA